MALTAALPAAAMSRARGVARARACAPVRSSATSQRLISSSAQAAFVAAPLAPVRKMLAPRNRCRAARHLVAVASAEVPPLASAKVITLTCAPALAAPVASGPQHARVGRKPYLALTHLRRAAPASGRCSRPPRASMPCTTPRARCSMSECRARRVALALSVRRRLRAFWLRRRRVSR